MLKSYRLMILGALLACGLFCAAGAKADPQSTDGRSGGVDSALYVPSGGTDASGTNRKALYSTTRALSTYDEDRDRDKVTLWQSLMSNASLAAAAGDSSGVIDVHAYRYLKLLLKATPIGAAANTTVRLAFQFRECMNGNADSSSSFPEYQYGRSDMGVLAGTTGVDTTFSGHLVTGTVSLPWSGEYVVQINMNRGGTGATGTALIFSYPNGISIPLDNFFGRAARFSKLQIRMRNLNITGPAVKYDLSLLGFAQ